MGKKLIYENYFNKTNSLIKSISRIFITMLIVLGSITFISAYREVSREVKTCLDEKFSLVLYSIASKVNSDSFIEEGKLETSIKSDLDGAIIGKYGFNAILNIEYGVIKAKYITDSPFKEADLEKSLNNEEDILEYIDKSRRPSKFMDLEFTVNAKNILIDGKLYRVRISNTNSQKYYLLTASGQDEYLNKMTRIIFNAILLTLIFTPILIKGSKMLLKILSKQLKDLNLLVENIIGGNADVSIVEPLCFSNNEIGILANSIKELVINLEEKSKTDELTGIGNRRKLYECLDSFNRKELKSSLSVVFMDIDYFKKYNDGYGHLRGDIALKKVASILKEVCLSRDILVSRYGGEEFVIIYPDCSEKDVLDLVKEIQESIKAADLEHLYSPVSNNITLSIGVAITNNPDIDVNDVLLKADEAVYKSKESGRNRYTYINV